MTKSTMTLKPGILVSLKTAKRGGIEYKRKNLDADGETAAQPACGECNSPVDKVTLADSEVEVYRCTNPACKTERPADAHTKVEKWETTKIVADKKANDAATRVRNQAGALIRAVCSQSAFGLICPESKESTLNEAIAEARTRVSIFNASDHGKTCQINLYVLKGRIASTDEEAVKAIRSELLELMDEMRDGIGAGNVEAARDAADRARKMGDMLDSETSKKVAAAIAEVRETASAVLKRMGKGEAAAEIVRDIRLKAVEEARSRFAHLDMDAPREVAPLPTVATRAAELDEDEGSVDREAETQPGRRFDDSDENGKGASA
ncbi:MAG TPA: hypothetical protein VFI56_20270 [Vicinamibacterales bacterium]|nr:hypothetical protein [Vicinamibacterales bacterium]